MCSLFTARRYEALSAKSQGIASGEGRRSDMSDWRNFLDVYGRQSAYCASSYHSEVFKMSLQFYSPFQKPIGESNANCPVCATSEAESLEETCGANCSSDRR